MTEDAIRALIQSAFDTYRGSDSLGIVENLRAAFAKDPFEFEGILREVLSSEDLPDFHYWFDVAGTERLSDSFFNLGVLFADEDFDYRAVECFAQSGERGLIAGSLAAGELLVWHGDFAEAEPYLLRVSAEIDDTGQQRKAAALLGVIYFERDGRCDDEVVQLLTAPGLETDTFTYTLAKVMKARGDDGLAREMFEQMVASGDSRATLDLGNMFWEANELDLAESAFLEGIKLGNWRCVYNLGSMLLDAGREAEGLQLVQKAAQDGDNKAIARLQKLAT